MTLNSLWFSTAPSGAGQDISRLESSVAVPALLMSTVMSFQLATAVPLTSVTSTAPAEIWQTIAEDTAIIPAVMPVRNFLIFI